MKSLTELLCGKVTNEVGQVSVALAIDALNRNLAVPINMERIVQTAERCLEHGIYK